MPVSTRCRVVKALLAVLILAVLGTAYALTRPGARFGPRDMTWYRSQVNRDLYVGVDPSYPPFAEWTPEQIAGIEPDIAREIGRRLGVEAQILIMGTDSLYDALFTGEVDMVIAGLQADPTQDEWVHYTQPYFDAGAVLVSPAHTPVTAMTQLDGQIVAVELASGGDQAAQQWQRRLHALTIKRCLLPADAIQAVLDGEAAAALVDTISARQELAHRPMLVMAAKTTAPQPYVIALRDGDFRMVKEVEKALRAMQNDGTLQAIIDRWLSPARTTS